MLNKALTSPKFFAENSTYILAPIFFAAASASPNDTCRLSITILNWRRRGGEERRRERRIQNFCHVDLFCNPQECKELLGCGE